jgi:hypothetical protein
LRVTRLLTGDVRRTFRSTARCGRLDRPCLILETTAACHRTHADVVPVTHRTVDRTRLCVAWLLSHDVRRTRDTTIRRRSLHLARLILLATATRGGAYADIIPRRHDTVTRTWLRVTRHRLCEVGGTCRAAVLCLREDRACLIECATATRRRTGRRVLERAHDTVDRTSLRVAWLLTLDVRRTRCSTTRRRRLDGSRLILFTTSACHGTGTRIRPRGHRTVHGTRLCVAGHRLHQVGRTRRSAVRRRCQDRTRLVEGTTTARLRTDRRVFVWTHDAVDWTRLGVARHELSDIGWTRGTTVRRRCLHRARLVLFATTARGRTHADVVPRRHDTITRTWLRAACDRLRQIADARSTAGCRRRHRSRLILRATAA